MAAAAMQGADQHIRNSFGFSILSKTTSTSREMRDNTVVKDSIMVSLDFVGQPNIHTLTWDGSYSWSNGPQKLLRLILRQGSFKRFAVFPNYNELIVQRVIAVVSGFCSSAFCLFFAPQSFRWVQLLTWVMKPPQKIHLSLFLLIFYKADVSFGPQNKCNLSIPGNTHTHTHTHTRTGIFRGVTMTL